MENMLTKIKNFLFQKIYNSEGRINRMQYLKYRIALFGFGLVLVAIVTVIANIFALINEFAGSIVAALLLFVMAFPIVLGDMLLGIRRCHDLNRTGWLIAIMLIPYVNIILAAYLMCWRGSEGSNDYGEDPALDLPPIQKVSLEKRIS